MVDAKKGSGSKGHARPCQPHAPTPRINVIPWPEIARRYREGESAYALSKTYPVSKAGILKRAKREGWTRDAALPTPTPSGGVLALGERTSQNMRLILEDIAAAVPVNIAAQAVGMTSDGVDAWAIDDPGFAKQLSAAKARGHVKRIKLIDSAGERGDWKAAGWLIERHAETRNEFRSSGNNNQGGGITINFRFARDADQPIVDVTPPRREIEVEASAA